MSQALEKLPQITGTQIISTLENMAGLGSIGRQVLSDLGIHKIDPEEKYSFYIRRRIHDAVLERYGPEALDTNRRTKYLLITQAARDYFQINSDAMLKALESK